MKPDILVIEVPTNSAMEARVEDYTAEGFRVVNYTATGVSMFKKRKFSFLWLAIGFFSGVVTEQEKDRIIEIRIVGPDGQHAFTT